MSKELDSPPNQVITWFFKLRGGTGKILEADGQTAFAAAQRIGLGLSEVDVVGRSDRQEDK